MGRALEGAPRILCAGIYHDSEDFHRRPSGRIAPGNCVRYIFYNEI